MTRLGDGVMPGRASAETWAGEQDVIGPGLQAVVQWAQIAIAHGEGSRVTDVDGNQYIDLMGGAGVNSVGHSHPRLVEALKAQLELWMVGSFSSPARLRMLQLVREILPSGLDRIQLYTSGAEAVEAAIRLAKAATGKYEFLSFWNGFHGKTLGAGALTAGARQGTGPLPSGFFTTPYANCYHCPLKMTYPGCGFACVDLARDQIRQQSTGALAAIVAEPIQGRSGNVPPPPGYMAALKELAREFDALLIGDETLTGFGRTGEMFGCDHDGVTPDIAIVGKGMGGGYPVSGVVASSELMSAVPFSAPSASSSSYGGFPMAGAAVAATLEVIRDERLVENARVVGEVMLAALQGLEETAQGVGQVRGRGLMIGIELVSDREQRSPVSAEQLRETFLALLRRGVIVMVGGGSLRLYPPLSIDAETALEAAETITDVLTNQS
jgi:4-aminobutyrate aminotransferase/4-aminobutyrate aminotransferase/(S)-3-amino-2-methylpropionate transaminase